MLNTTFIIWSASVGLFGLIFSFFNTRKYVLFAFALFGAVSPIIWGFMETSGSLSLAGGRLWSVLDVLFLLLLLISYPIARKNIAHRYINMVDVCMFVLSALIALNLAVGYFRLGTFANVANVFRRFMSVPVYFAAIAIFSDAKTIKQFYKWTMIAVIPLFVLHLLIALRVYLPPLYFAMEELQELWMDTEIARSTLYFYEPFYVVAACIAVCYIVYGSTYKLLAWITLPLCGLGSLLTQTRSVYGGVFLLFVGMFLFMKGKLKHSVIAAIFVFGALAGLYYAGSRGIDFLYRMRIGVPRQGFFETVRGGEFPSLWNSFEETPAAFLTGQGFGISHEGIGARNRRGYFHSDYLGSFFSLGIIGFLCFCYIVFSTIFRGRRYCAEPAAALIVMPVRLIFLTVAGMAVFNQQFWYYKGTGFLMMFLAISSNIDMIVHDLYAPYQIGFDMESDMEQYALEYVD